LVFQPDFLLGAFVALLAVKPAAAGRGVGRRLMGRSERMAFARKRWLWVSSDSDNRQAARFYRKLGFVRVARLPDLIRDGRTEILWRKGRS
jgi:ribosomal protein S18 acetylase RimI-like enzyme